MVRGMRVVLIMLGLGNGGGGLGRLMGGMWDGGLWMVMRRWSGVFGKEGEWVGWVGKDEEVCGG